ncbi:MAG: hypothetical protein RLN76_06910 [Phycisphaeraceae bacterium]
MIRLTPSPPLDAACPHDGSGLHAHGWAIPGMRCLAEASCPECNRRYYVDLPAGNGLLTPMTLDADTGEVFNADTAPWFATWLADSYSQRHLDTLPSIKVEKFRTLQRPLLINALDRLYGHGLLKLLSLQRDLEQHPDHDIIALVPSYLRWMVPPGVAEIWSVDWPQATGSRWSAKLDHWVHDKLSLFDDAKLSHATPHPAPRDVTIERFTSVAPFPQSNWQHASTKPIITFIWRDDRTWPEPIPAGRRRAKLNTWLNRIGLATTPDPRMTQKQHVEALAAQLTKRFPALDFAIVGPGEPESWNACINDLREPRITPAIERQWCQRYASSHVVIGVHGSNMLLPSAHAGSVIDLMPRTRWQNLGQDLLLRDDDPRREIYRCRAIPASASVSEVVRITQELLRHTRDHLAQTHCRSDQSQHQRPIIPHHQEPAAA